MFFVVFDGKNYGKGIKYFVHWPCAKIEFFPNACGKTAFTREILFLYYILSSGKFAGYPNESGAE